MLEALFTSRHGGYIVMIAIFGLIALLLRGLFGPRGIFRDPEWDESNRKIRAEEEQKRAARLRQWEAEHGSKAEKNPANPVEPQNNEAFRDMDLPEWMTALIPAQAVQTLPEDLLEHCRNFIRFVLPYTEGDGNGPVRIKVEHSFFVMSHVRTLVRAHGADCFGSNSELYARAAILAGLYHDCGRFPQHREYGTFLDAASVNHALMGLRTLREQGFLQHEAKAVRQLVQTAVLLHNRYALPERLDPTAALITHMVRDADKLDIMRVMALHLNAALPDRDTVVLNVKDEPKYSDVILRDVMEGRVPRYVDMRYVNDFRLLLGTWPRELRFEATKQVLRDSGLIESILLGLPEDATMREARELILCGLAVRPE